MHTNQPTVLTPAQLSEQTGVAPGTLRVWTARHGFPGGDQQPGSRRRRYTEADVEAVRAVQRLREEGMSLAAAIAQVQGAVSTPESSIYAALRRRRPDLRPYVMVKRALLRLSHAIEDEHRARAGSGLLLGSFQSERHYRASRRRWRELSRTVGCAVALADFRSLREPAEGPIEVPLPSEHQLGREWTLIVDSPQARACLSAWEFAEARASRDSDRRFEVIWSFEPAVVADATAAARSLLGDIAPSVAARIPAKPRPARAPDTEIRFGVELANRAYGYLADDLSGRPRRRKAR
jgi:MerR family transcriptional regulator, light-induced transcriptional regulator